MTNAVSVAVTSMPESVVSEWIVPTITTLIGAFAGAILAFMSDRWLRKKEDRDQKIMAGDQALFALHQQLHNLLTLYNHVRAEGFSNPFLMPMSPVRIEWARLFFIRRKHPDDLNKIFEVERWYDDVCDALADYNRKASVCNAVRAAGEGEEIIKILAKERDSAYQALIKSIRTAVKYNYIASRTLHRILASTLKKVKFHPPKADENVSKQFDLLKEQFDAAATDGEKTRLRAEMDQLVFKLYLLPTQEGAEKP